MWDVFISHAWEDKQAVARPLAEALKQMGLQVWYDEMTLTLGDSLRQSIDRGLAESKFGVVILSHHFFAKTWTQRELDGLTTRETQSGKIILPIWHQVTREEVERFSPMLADRISVSTDDGMQAVVENILHVVQAAGGRSETQSPPRPMRQRPRFDADPIFYEPFDNNEYLWAIGSDGNWDIVIEDGVLAFTNLVSEGEVEWHFIGFTYQDFQAEVTVRFDVGRSQGYGAYAGLICRHDEGNFYYFAINNGSGYAFGKHDNVGDHRWQYLTEQLSPIILPGQNANRLVITADGNQFNLTVNDHLLTTLIDDSFSAPGNIGVVAMSPTKVAFDDLKVFL